MSAYVPEFVYGIVPGSFREHGGPRFGLIPWPAHLQPRESSGIELTKKAEAYIAGHEGPAASAVEAAGVIFLTLDPKDRTTLSATIERLINLLDAIGPDPDLEPSLGCANYSYPASQLQWCVGSDDDREDDNDREPDLGWSERNSQGADEARRNGNMPVYSYDPAGDPGGADLGQLHYDGSGKAEAERLLRSASKRNDHSGKVIGERVRVLQDGHIFRTYVPADSGYVLVPKKRRVRQTVRP